MNPQGHNERVLILAPVGRDGRLIQRTLSRDGLDAEACDSMQDLCTRWETGIGCAVFTEESLSMEALACLSAQLEKQPPWSDIPLIILSGGGKTTRFSVGVARVLEERGNVTFLERPVRMLTLLSAVQSALRARRRQYEVRALLNQAQSAVQQRDQFLAMLGHELRNPHAAIRTAVEILRRFGLKDEQLALEQCDIIVRQSQNVARLVDDLLDVALVTSGKVGIHRQPVDLREIGRRALEALKLAIPEQRHDVRFTCCAEAAVVDGDPVRLEQVITNLLTNAIKYTPAGGEVHLTVSRESDCAVARVRDTGDGIAPENLQRIFEPFVQEPQSLARSRGGLGLGLTVVRSLIELHGGTVSAASAGLGCGSEFIVRIPLASTQMPVMQDLADDGRCTPRRVLIIEDNADARKATVRLLQLMGHQVDSAEDGESGVLRALNCHPEVAFVDIGLPVIDGYEVARRIRAELGETVYLVAVTGYGQDEDRMRAHAAGFNCHMIKPVNPDRLARVLTDAGNDGRWQPVRALPSEMRGDGAVNTRQPAGLPCASPLPDRCDSDRFPGL